MRNFKKLFAGLLALVMAVSLLACGKKEVATPPTDGQPITEAPATSVGFLVLSGDTRYTLHYDGKGNITAITDRDDAACFSDLFGSACTAAASQIITNSDVPLASTHLLVKLGVDSLLPKDNFLADFASEIEKASGNLPVIVCDAADQNVLGYFSSATATKILRAYFGVAETACSVSSEPVDGYYRASVMGEDGVINVTVGALYGTITEQTEITEDFTEIPDEQYFPDYEVIDPYWEIT